MEMQFWASQGINQPVHDRHLVILFPSQKPALYQPGLTFDKLIKFSACPLVRYKGEE